jgi:hypothetical protein
MKKNNQSAGEQSADVAGDLPPKLGSPARRALVRAGVTRLEQLSMLTEAELLKLHGMGPKAIGQLREALAAAGRSFAKP